jgi:Fe-S cluster assembly protein SufD
VALNTALIQDGAFIHIGRGAVLEKPIHLIFVSTVASQPIASHPRVLMLADENCEAPIVETYAGHGGGPYLTNVVSELIVADNARIDHCRVQQETAEAFHIAAMHVDVGRGAAFVSQAATIGGKLTRNDLHVHMNGAGADATLNGLVVIGGDQHADNHTLLHHAAPNCPSHELYKYVVDGRASGVFKGKIYVEPVAQKTDAKQTSKSLLLSDDAKMYSQPMLQIYADDVKCTHGSTTGPVDEEMVFYLRSRGVGLDAARHLLTYAFAADITRRIRIEPVRRLIEDFMAAQHGLPRDLRITDLGHHHDQVAV